MYKRVKFLTHSKVQLKFATVFLVWFLVFLGLFAFIFLLNLKTLTERTDVMQIHDQLTVKLMLMQQSEDLVIWYGLAAFAYVVLMCTYVVVYSHRLTGPIYKLSKHLNDSAETKKWPGKISFRRTDAFHDLEEAFNKFLETYSPKQ